MTGCHMSDYVRAGNRMRKDSLDDGIIVDAYIYFPANMNILSVLIPLLSGASRDKSLRTFITRPMLAP